MALLSACDNRPASQESIDALQSQVDSQRTQIVALEAKISDLESSVNNLREISISTAEAHESLRKTFNRNVDIDNNAKVARMTANGACGQETIYYPNGGYTVRNKECTLKDLR